MNYTTILQQETTMEYNIGTIVEMEIVLKEPLPQNELPLYTGNRSRYPSVTDIVFVSHDRIVVAHRYACKLYYIELDETLPLKYRILDTIVLKINGHSHLTEMMDIHNSTIYLISYTEYVTIIDVIGDRLRVRKSMALNHVSTPYHGIQIFEDSVYITPSNKGVGDDTIIVLDALTTRIMKRLQLSNMASQIRIKDITFISKDRIVLLGNYKVKTSMIMPGHIIHGFIGLYTKDFVKIHSVSFISTHFDSVTSKNGIFYATGSDLEGGYIYTGRIENDTIAAIKKHIVADFPHGISIYNTKLAYTSYATSAVYITDISNYE